jgi:hypothetical protein
MTPLTIFRFAWFHTNLRPHSITPWVTNLGYQNAFLIAAFVALAQISFCFVFIKWGRQLRKASVLRYWKFVQQVKEDGLAY